MRYHKGRDGWGRDSYAIPQYAVAGSSDTGRWSDSPAPTDKVHAELNRVRKEVLRPAGIRARIVATQSGNAFMRKLWITVHSRDFQAAAQLVSNWLAKHNADTNYVHDADLDQLGISPAVDAPAPQAEVASHGTV